MEIIDGTGTDKMNRVFSAGVELVEKLRGLLVDHGLSDEDAAGVLLIASGGVLTSNDEIDPSQYFSDLGTSCSLWHRREGVPGLAGALFYPHTHSERFHSRRGEN